MTYRLLSASKDTYITDKIISGQRATHANVGEAGTLDLFKLHNESTLPGTPSGSNVVEISRLLIQFDYSPITLEMLSDSSFTASLRLIDVYGGQTVPSNFTLVAYPLSKSFDEGRGFDVFSYRDLDQANFLTASLGVTWSLSGANAKGTLGDDIDVIVSGDIGSGLEYLGVTHQFSRGDENALFNITNLVSASVAGIIPNHGFRISYVDAQETDNVTRFVKRFGSRHTFNKLLRPKLLIEYNSDRIKDTSGDPRFSLSQSFYTYHTINGNMANFVSGGSEITGQNSLIFKLEASKSIQYMTSSFQPNFSASINHLTRSVVYYSQSFSASQESVGIYSCNFMLDPTVDAELNNFISSGFGREVEFKGTWKSTDTTLNYASNYFKFKKLSGGFSNVDLKNYVVNAVNLKDEYTQDDEARIRVFVQDYDLSQKAFRYPTALQSVVVPDMRWRLIKAYSKETVVPFSVNTKMSFDKDGMYFDLFVQDLDLNEVYELEFMIKNDTGKDFIVKNKGFVFKITS